VGLAPTGKRRLSTAHAKILTHASPKSVAAGLLLISEVRQRCSGGGFFEDGIGIDGSSCIPQSEPAASQLQQSKTIRWRPFGEKSV
jgi:hypothetical protein